MSEIMALDWILSILLIAGLVIACYPFRKQKKIIVFLAPIIALAISFAYLQWGGSLQWSQYLQQKKNNERVKALLASIKNPEELVVKLKLRLQNDPNSAEGWFLLGRIYASQNQWEEAREAFSRSKQLKSDERIQINYIQSLWQLNNRQFNEKIRRAYRGVLAKNPNQPDALAMLAMDAYIRHDNDAAMKYWQHLLTLVPSDSEDAQAIRKAIAKIQG